MEVNKDNLNRYLENILKNNRETRHLCDRTKCSKMTFLQDEVLSLSNYIPHFSPRFLVSLEPNQVSAQKLSKLLNTETYQLFYEQAPKLIDL